ncbi:MAG: beta-ketoacyl synthase N-terminal-like domain-containing protein [bacterium]|nr:beta-ketoacyl synthase N-terminal-like domain-containing protein [bacterium]
MFQRIAVISLACLFPGAKNPEEFLDNLFAGRDLTRDAGLREIGLDPSAFLADSKGQPDKYYNLRGGFIDDFHFDAQGYRVHPKRLESLDEVCQWPTWVGREALTKAGYWDKPEALERCGLILGNLSFPTKSSNRLVIPLYHQAQERGLRRLLENPSVKIESAGPSALENRRISGRPALVAAEALGLGGVSLALDAACASSLYALALAAEYLASGKTDMMLAGAVSAADPFFVNMGFSTFQAYPLGRNSAPLDKNSQGLVAGEGAGLFLLKRYEDALRDGDTIEAVLVGYGLSNDGAGKGILSPNPKGQRQCFERAYEGSDLKPEDLEYVECHATGTPLGDKTELTSMEEFFAPTGADFPIGSVKSNFGHLLTAAGMASMMKVILAMKEGRIPATIHLKDPLSSAKGWIDGDKMVTSERPWPAKHPEKRLGAVNAFGFGGTNAHVIFERAPKPTKLPRALKPRPVQTPLSIVGMEAWFGSAQGLDQFQAKLYEARPDSRPLPKTRWSGLERLRAVAPPQGAWLKPFDFDFLTHKIPPNPADPLISQQLLMLKVADRAIRDAGLKPGSKVAVLVGMETDLGLHRFRGRVELDLKLPMAFERAGLALSDAERAQLKEVTKDALHNPVGFNQFTSFIGNIMACRVASQWDFTGPAFSVSSEDSTGYKALELAQLLLASGQAEAVVLGGVDLLGAPEECLLQLKENPTLVQGAAGHYWSKGHEGSQPGEGAGALVLTTKKRALEDRLPVYAHIEAIERFGPKTRSGALKRLYKDLGKPGYLEVSALAEQKLAQIEAKGLARELKDQVAALGSVSSVFGRLEASLGVAALIKTALALKLKYIPGTADWKGPKAELGLQSPLYVPQSSRPWLSFGQRRLAAVNHLALSGEDYHILLGESETPALGRPMERWTHGLRAFKFTAKSLKALLDQLEAGELAEDQFLAESWGSTQAKDQGKFRLVLLAASPGELVAERKAALEGIAQAAPKGQDWHSPAGSTFSAQDLTAQGKLAFVYPGGFNSYLGMGAGLMRFFPELHDLPQGYAKDPASLFRDQQIFPRRLEPLDANAEKELQIELVRDAIAMFETGINASMLQTQVLRRFLGVEPDAALGYSMGEVTMAFALGLWENTDSLSEYLHKKPVFQTHLAGPMETVRKAWKLKKGQKVDWITLAVRAPRAALEAAVAQRDRVYLMIQNSPTEAVVGGERAALLKMLKATGFEARELPISDAIHADFVQADYKALKELHTCPVVSSPALDFYTARTYQTTETTERQLAENIAGIYCQSVDFPRLIEKAYQDGTRLFVELGPRQSCSKWIDEILGSQAHLALGLDQKGMEGDQALLRALAKLTVQGVLVDWSLFAPPVNQMPLGKGKMPQLIDQGSASIEEHILTEGRKLLGRGPSPSQHIFPDIPEPAPQNLAPAPAGPPAPAVSARELTLAEPAPPAFEPGSLLAQSRAMAALYQTRQRISENHRAFLLARKQGLRQYAGQLVLNQQLLDPQAPVPVQAPVDDYKEQLLYRTPTLPELLAQHPTAFVDSGRRKESEPGILWDETDLMEFAAGKIAPVFGPEYGVIDQYGPRVRLPLPPYLLVNRVTGMTAEKRSLKPSKMITEYDVPANAWHCVDGQIPWAVAVEAGQCDLVLISYLGVDFENQGTYLYRLLDCTLTFKGEMPREGQTMRYEIYIDSFAKHGHNLLFFFHYDCFVGDQLVHTMTDGCAGFFSQEDLDKGKGVILTEKEKAERAKVVPQRFEPPMLCGKKQFGRAELVRLCRGEISACLGPQFDQQGRNGSLRFSTEEFLMLDRITEVAPFGGLWGLGEVRAQKDFKPDHWYFPCHFKDDSCLAGSLMAEGCVQLLEFYLLYIGMQTQTQNARFVPIKNLANKVRCRGQVLPGDGLLEYRMEVKEIGLHPRPYAKANVDIILDGKVIVDFLDVGIELVEKEADSPKALQAPETRDLALTDAQIEEFALGSLSQAFGPEFDLFEGRPSQRNPNGALQLVSRATRFEGTRGDFKQASFLETEYDIAPDAWFLLDSHGGVTPYAVIMEIALQPCGVLGAMMGSPLLYPEEQLCFRNLDAQAEMLADPPLAGQRVTCRCWLDSTSASGGTIIQQYRFELWVAGDKFYQGKTTFGYFTPKALANQLGLDSGKKRPFWHETSRPLPTTLDLKTNRTLFQGSPRLGRKHLNFLDQVGLDPMGGIFGKGYVYGKKAVDAADWFFPCHFFEDPVMPGSLGVEAIIQSLRVFALEQGLYQDLINPRFTHALGNCQWKYRGQIIPQNEWMETEAHIKGLERGSGWVRLSADASLYKEGLRIYEVTDLSIVIEEQR